MEHENIIPGVIKAVCQSVLVETEQCPLIESVALTTQHIDSTRKSDGLSLIREEGWSMKSFSLV